MTVSKALKYERLKRGMTQNEFAEFLESDRGSIAHYESGRIPLPITLKKFSEKLGIDLAKILIEERE